MLRKVIILAVIAALIGVAVFWVVTIPATVPASALAAYSPDLGNGKTMFFAGGCSSCHATPNQDDKMRLGGGLALKSPFGTFYVPNISSDRDNGIGGWSEEQFVTAMLRGSADGAHLYPAFPYTSYAHMQVGDVRDMFAFMRTLPAAQSSVGCSPQSCRTSATTWSRAECIALRLLSLKICGCMAAKSARMRSWKKLSEMQDALLPCV